MMTVYGLIRESHDKYKFVERAVRNRMALSNFTFK